MKTLLFLFFFGSYLITSCTKVDEHWMVNQNSVTIIDSSKTVIGDTNIFNISFNPVINLSFVDSSKNYIVVNVAGSNFYLSVKDSVTVNNNLSNVVSVQGDSLFVNNNIVNQNSCPFDSVHCVIGNCKWHHKYRFNHYHC